MEEQKNTVQTVQMMTINAIAKEGLAPAWALRRWVLQGEIPVVRSGNRAYINRQKLLDFLNSEQ